MGHLGFGFEWWVNPTDMFVGLSYCFSNVLRLLGNAAPMGVVYSAAHLTVCPPAPCPQARQDSVNTEKAVAWLTNAHAEERAARQALKGQLQELQGVLERERQAHNAAVSKYVAEVEERCAATRHPGAGPGLPRGDVRGSGYQEEG